MPSFQYNHLECCCGKPYYDDSGAQPTPCHVCRANSDQCECCGAHAPNGDGCYPYGFYCDACGDDITHPTGYGFCFVEDGKEHRSAKPLDWKPCDE